MEDLTLAHGRPTIRCLGVRGVMRRRGLCLVTWAAAVGGAWGALRAEAAGKAPAAASPVLACRAGSLPRLTEASITGGAPSLVDASKRGGVAVAWDGTRATIVSGCRLDGDYVVIPGRGGKGVFRATNRVLFRTDELAGDCRRATHVIAALATGGPRLRAILVPLPCPPVAQLEPAPGCLGKALTGKQRRLRAAQLGASLIGQADKLHDPGIVLTAFA